MENASKALLIAAGVLIAILLVAFGIRILGSAGDTAEQAKGVGDSMSLTTQDATSQLGTIFRIVPKGGEYKSKNGTTYYAGEKMPDEYFNGDTYQDSDYKYTLIGTFKGMVAGELTFGAPYRWKVEVKDKNKSSYGKIQSNINGINITSLQSTFLSCTKLTSAPKIPNTVTDLTNAFANCTSLVQAPNIPASVKNMTSTFLACSELKNLIVINANPTSYSGCFSYTQKEITITGDCPIKSELAATASNGNVTWE